MNICIVSPHLDDALLSCGILMQRQAALGNRVFVLNIFSAGANAKARQQEDRNAVEALGATAHFLDELDAPDRNAAYKADIEIFFGALDPAHPSINKVEGLLRKFFEEHGIDVAYFPLGAGTHIDHRIAFEAGRRIAGVEVRFYEDRPYILWIGNLQRRMKELGIDASLPPVDAQTMRASLKGYHRLKHLMTEQDYEERCVRPFVEGVSAAALKATSEELIATPEEVRRLFDALSLYESQMPFIYPSYDDFIQYNRDYELFNSGRDVYAERSWKLGG